MCSSGERYDRQYWRELERAMRETGDFSDGRRLKHFALRQTYYAKRAVVYPATEGYVPRQKIWGYGAILKTKDPEWVELGLVYVAPERRRKGWSRRIVQQLVDDVPSDTRVFAITSKPVMMKVLDSCGFEPVTAKTTPDVSVWGLRVGLKNEIGSNGRLPESALTILLPNPVEGERWLFMRKA